MKEDRDTKAVQMQMVFRSTKLTVKEENVGGKHI